VGLPAGTPGGGVAEPDPSPTPPTPPERGPNFGPPSPTQDAGAGFADSAAGAEPAQSPGIPAAGSLQTTAAQAGSGAPHGGFERVEAGHPGASIVELPAQPTGRERAADGLAGRLSADAHLVGRGEDARGDSGRAADPLTTRRDPARPDSGRDDRTRPGGARPGKLPRRGGVPNDPGANDPISVAAHRDNGGAGPDGEGALARGDGYTPERSPDTLGSGGTNTAAGESGRESAARSGGASGGPTPSGRGSTARADNGTIGPPGATDSAGGGGAGDPADFHVALRDGRKLQCRAEGPADGTPVVQLHGMPGGRLDTAPAELLERLNIRLITYDRPGYGGSDPHPGHRVVDGAADVAAIADHLGLDRFAVVGRSGGTAYALAVAAELGDRVTRLALLVPVVHPSLMGEDFHKGMYQEQFAGAAEERHAARREAFLADPTDPTPIFGIPLNELSDTDRSIITSNWEHLCRYHAEGLKQGSAAWDENFAAQWRRPWGIDFADVRAEILVWTAGGDEFTPASHAVRLAQQFPSNRCRLYVVSGTEVGHFGAMMIKPGVFGWLTASQLTRIPTQLEPAEFVERSDDVPRMIPTTLDQWTSLRERG
jgi:pimeloyl-ACP methyl ester carboxylesterase